MWGALIGLAGTAISSLLSNKASARKAKELNDYLDKKETRLDNAYNYTRGLNEASINSVLSQNKDNMLSQLGYVSGVEGVLGGPGYKTAELSNQAIQGNVQAARQATQLRSSADQQAYATYQSGLNSIDEAREKELAAERDNTAQAGANLSTAFLGLAQDDITSHLESGKGLFSDVFGKGSKSTGKVGGTSTTPRVINNYSIKPKH